MNLPRGERRGLRLAGRGSGCAEEWKGAGVPKCDRWGGPSGSPGMEVDWRKLDFILSHGKPLKHDPWTHKCPVEEGLE